MLNWVFFLKYVRTIIKKEAVPGFETASFLYTFNSVVVGVFTNRIQHRCK